jgi:hypothetical protein
MHCRTCSADLPDISVRYSLYSIRYTIAGTEGSSSSQIIFIVTVELLQLDILHDDCSARRTVARLESHLVCSASPYRSPTTSWRKGISKSDKTFLYSRNPIKAKPIQYQDWPKTLLLPGLAGSPATMPKCGFRSCARSSGPALS